MDPSPRSEFIPVTEDTRLILPMGEWVIQEACRTLTRLDPAVSVAVNLSPRQLVQQDLPRVVGAALLRPGLLPSALSSS